MASFCAGVVGGVRHDVVVARGEAVDLSGRHVDALQVGVALLADADENRAPVAGPDRAARELAARRALVAADAAVDVEVVGRREVARRSGAELGHPQIGLGVGAFGVANERADEGDALAVGRQRIGADRSFDARDPGRLTAIPGDRIQVAVAGVVVRLAPAVGHEVEARSVGRPAMVGGGELAGGDRRGRRLLAGVGRDRHDPDLGRAIAIDVAEARDAVGAIDRFGDDAHVGFSRLVGRRLLRRGQIGGTRGRRKGDRLAVRCPLRVARTARDVGDGPRLAARDHGHDVDLSRLRPAVLLDGAEKGQPAAVGRPARAGIAGAARDRARRLAAVGLREPDGRVVGVLLLVDGHAHEGHLRAVGEICGSATHTNEKRSLSVIGRRCACAGYPNTTSERVTNTERKISNFI